MTCRARKYATEDIVRRVLWAIKLNGRLGNADVRYCSSCRAWHIVRGK